MSWSVYCISFGFHEKTYVGATVNFARRIRQHNGELVGGAKYTTNAKKSQQQKEWRPLFLVHNFPHQRGALQFEWALKHETMKFRHIKGTTERRKHALESLLKKERVTSTAEPLASWNLNIEYIQNDGGSCETEGPSENKGGSSTITNV